MHGSWNLEYGIWRNSFHILHSTFYILYSFYLFQRPPRRFYFSFLFGISLPFGDEFLSEVHSDSECPLVRGTRFFKHLVGRRELLPLLNKLLKLALRILVTPRFQNLVEPDHHESVGEFPHLFEPVIKINRPDYRLNRVRKNHLPRLAHIPVLSPRHKDKFA